MQNAQNAQVELSSAVWTLGRWNSVLTAENTEGTDMEESLNSHCLGYFYVN